MGLEKMNMSGDAAIKAVGVFGGGIASSGNVCGILLGGVAMLSTLYSRASLEEQEDRRLWAVSRKFMQQFEALAQPFGGITCHAIAGIDWHDRQVAKAYYSDPTSSRQKCVRLLGDAAHVLGVILEQEAERE